MTSQPSTNKYFGKIETREHAAKVIREAAYLCFVIAALQIGFSFVFGREIFIDAAIYVVLGLPLFFLT